MPATHGGLDGIRDKNAVESDLARPEQLETYSEPKSDAADLATAYAHGLVLNHGYSDGSKRTAWVVVRVFLADNGIKLLFSAIEAIRAMEQTAAGSLSEQDLAQWFRQRIVE
ncbi:Fic family protein [Glaciimonas sp. Gout2]|uniref:type II toxin-antitoxin system death-on-curing family toxin n=1 Tax=unclassified Glaciimonas TaxID=2644401 RepID=UPI002B23B1AF|nr:MULTISPECIES: Fic family protein [unclassified Glaciimonas]MEB0012679.1 Fic family protein [Glaciimonas sp. Cout2]MEB0082980.1 Fic family protein [Glaciimonas sp. Gout2]